MLDLDLLKIMDDENNIMSYGCNQLWYHTEWQRRAGCGPSVVSNIFIYLFHHYFFDKWAEVTKDKAINIMEEVWDYVTPSMRGVNTTKMLFDGAIEYAQSKSLTLNYSFLDIPNDNKSHLKMDEIIEFIEKGLAKNTPIAFLNLCNGKEERLYRWHWVTLVAVKVDKNQNNVCADILDDGEIFSIDLLLWLNTTTLGGGFVYFY
jgi:hypothetical protein